MSDWDGKDRRDMNQDWVERDRLLTEVHSNMKHLLDWSKTHTTNDDKYQEKTDKTLDELKSFKWKQIGGITAIVVLTDLIIRVAFKS